MPRLDIKMVGGPAKKVAQVSRVQAEDAEHDADELSRQRRRNKLLIAECHPTAAAQIDALEHLLRDERRRRKEAELRLQQQQQKMSSAGLREEKMECRVEAHRSSSGCKYLTPWVQAMLEADRLRWRARWHQVDASSSTPRYKIAFIQPWTAATPEDEPIEDESARIGKDRYSANGI